MPLKSDSLPACMRNVPAVFQRMTIWAENFKIFQTVIPSVSVSVMHA
jgi:hypothetical protein